MLWIALHFPLLPLEAFLPPSACEPWVALDGARVVIGNAPACAQGIRTGMPLAAACALVPKLRYRSCDHHAECAALEHIAAWAGQFTPSVSLQQTAGLLLEIEGSLKLLGGIQRIGAMIKSGVAAMGYTLRMACAPTVTAAWLLARGGQEKIVPCKRRIEPAIAALPVTVLDCDSAALEILADIGVKTIADVWRLPRAGLARRCGEKLLHELDRALGALPEARTFYAPPPSFEAAIEFATDVTDASALLFAARRLATQLVGYLAGRSAGVQHFNIVLAHEHAAPTVLEIRLVTPTREIARLDILIRERLSAHKLAAPVCRITLRADDILAFAGESGALFADHAKTSGDRARLIERLRARLGVEAVQGLVSRDGHRPEFAWQLIEPGAKNAQIPHIDNYETARQCGFARRSPRPLGEGLGVRDRALSRSYEKLDKRRPLWLLHEPRRLQEVGSKPHSNNQPLALIAGPERIESGWWDDMDVKRDYFVAQTADDSLLWIYRDRRGAGGWYLHGIFG